MSKKGIKEFKKNENVHVGKGNLSNTNDTIYSRLHFNPNEIRIGGYGS